jgi:hypothetical protein
MRAARYIAVSVLPAGRLEPLGVLAQPNRVPLDPLQYHVGQDQPGPLDRRERVELDGRAAVAVLLDGQHAAAERRPVAGLVDEPAEQPLGDVAVLGHDFRVDAAAEGARLLGRQQRDRRTLVAEQVQAPLDARQLPAAGQVDVGVLDRPLVELGGRPRPGELGQRDVVVLLRDDDADQARVAAGVGEELFDGEVEVRAMVGLQVLFDDR